jgi:hypothetical protein
MNKVVLSLLLTVYVALGVAFAVDGRWGLVAGCAGLAALAVSSYWLRRRTTEAPQEATRAPATLSDEQAATVRELIRTGKQVRAVRYVRRETGLGLIAAAKAIDAVTQAGAGR